MMLILIHVSVVGEFDVDVDDMFACMLVNDVGVHATMLILMCMVMLVTLMLICW